MFGSCRYDHLAARDGRVLAFVQAVGTRSHGARLLPHRRHGHPVPGLRIMTWSIVARDADGAFGAAVASRAFAVGALCPYARSGVGALCTQALVNPHYATPGLDLLSQGTPPDEVLRLLTGPDEGRDHRQLHMVDARGRTAAYTGAKCV